MRRRAAAIFVRRAAGSPICLPHCLPHRLFSSHTAAGNLQEVIAAHRQVLPIVDPLSAKPPKADIVARPPNILLCQNARALTSPREMVKIDADWVVLSACNTAAGAG